MTNIEQEALKIEYQGVIQRKDGIGVAILTARYVLKDMLSSIKVRGYHIESDIESMKLVEIDYEAIILIQVRKK